MIEQQIRAISVCDNSVVIHGVFAKNVLDKRAHPCRTAQEPKRTSTLTNGTVIAFDQEAERTEEERPETTVCVVR